MVGAGAGSDKTAPTKTQTPSGNCCLFSTLGLGPSYPQLKAPFNKNTFGEKHLHL